jgi:hypothetical protein
MGTKDVLKTHFSIKEVSAKGNVSRLAQTVPHAIKMFSV